MDDLVQFLRARLDEDELAARAWPDHQQDWEARGPRHLSYASGSGESVTAVSVGGDGPLGWERIYVKRDPGDLAEHIARHDPARALREVEAWRTLLKEHEGLLDGVPDDFTGVWSLEAVMRSKAVVYADHPDYQDDWRP